MKRFYKTIKFVLYNLFTKKTLFTIIFVLFCYILLSNTSVFAAGVNPVPAEVISAFENAQLMFPLDDCYYIIYYGGDYSGVSRWDLTLIPKKTDESFVSYLSGGWLNGHFSNNSKFNLYNYKYYNSSVSSDGYFPNNTNFTGTYDFEAGFTCNFDIYTDSSLTDIFYQGGSVEPVIIYPSILNTETDLTGLLSNTITIDVGNQDLENLRFVIYQHQIGISRTYNVYDITLDSTSPFYNANGVNNAYYDIPISNFKDRLISGYVVNYTLYYKVVGEEESHTDFISTIYTPDLTDISDTEQVINIINRNNSILTSTINDTNEYLRDDNFNNSDLNIPSDNTEDITEEGIDNIFLQIYNGFTSGTPSDIVIPIPFTNKTFTINSDLTKNILNSNGFGWVKTIVEAFWWYIISTFIVKDISKKMNKIKSGDFENIETNNIKEDML